MSRRILAIAFSVFLLAAAPLSAASDDALYLRMSLQSQRQHPHSKAAEYFARLVGRRSGGRIEIRTYANGELGDSGSTLRQIEFGGIAVAVLDAGVLVDMVPGSDRESTGKAFDENWDSLVSELAENYGLVPLTQYYPELICIYSGTRGIESFEDVSRLDIGVIGDNSIGKALTGTGSHVIAIDADEAYASLSNGYLDAVAEAFIEFYQSERYLMMKKVSVSEAGVLPSLLVINKDIFNSLKSEDQQLIFECAKLSKIYDETLLRRAEEKALDVTSASHDLFIIGNRQ